MTDERAYRQDGLTIGGLAQQLGLPEYRLRRLINQALGYRNFNSFVNRYRIAEVKAALADPRQAEVPVLTMALDAGFSSLGPFNRAFKAETGMTPSEYRRDWRIRPADSRIGEPCFELGEKQSWPLTRASPSTHRQENLHAPCRFPSPCWAPPLAALLGCGSLDRATDVATGYRQPPALLGHLRLQGRARAVLSRVDRAHPVAGRASCRATGSTAQRAQVTSSFAGVAEARAVDRGPLGCLVLHDEPPAPAR